jgi:hypothetical protein
MKILQTEIHLYYGHLNLSTNDFLAQRRQDLSLLIWLELACLNIAHNADIINKQQRGRSSYAQSIQGDRGGQTGRNPSHQTTKIPAIPSILFTSTYPIHLFYPV